MSQFAIWKTTRGTGHCMSQLGRAISLKSLYKAGPLHFTAKEFQITLLDDDDGSDSQRRQRNFKVVIKFVARANLHRLGMFLAGKHAEAPQEALQVLDILLWELSFARYAPFGRSFFSPDLGRRQPLGDGLEGWCGFCPCALFPRRVLSLLI